MIILNVNTFVNIVDKTFRRRLVDIGVISWFAGGGVNIRVNGVTYEDIIQVCLGNSNGNAYLYIHDNYSAWLEYKKRSYTKILLDDVVEFALL